MKDRRQTDCDNHAYMCLTPLLLLAQAEPHCTPRHDRSQLMTSKCKK